ncbi:MAG: hypothetical protein AB1469_09215 [Pseudomonadota bacterium]
MSEIVENKKTTIREAGKNELWLQDWISEKPERLGIGPFDIVAQEMSHLKSGGGRLDILGFSKQINTFYEIEVMLGECDADHGFRCLDYWARERILKPNSLHYAVLVAENLQGRYKTLIDTLPQFIPFIAVEIRTLKLMVDGEETMATTYAEIVSQPDELIFSSDSATPPIEKSSVLRDEAWWRDNSYPSFVDDVQAMQQLCEQHIGPSRIDYTANSYISLKKGRRAWLPMWPRTNGFYAYIPDNGSGTLDEPSERFRQVQQKLQSIGIEASWTFKYNAGANPIGFAVPRDKMNEEVLLQILLESYALA